MTDPEHAVVVHAFLEQVAQDQEEDGVRPLAEYQAMWPGHGELVAREYAALTDFGSGSLSGPRRVAHYRIEDELGRGAQGIVYLAVDERLGRQVALKVLHPAAALDPRALLRFRREALAASRLDDPGICTVFDSGVEGGVTYIAMRYVEGETLGAWISRCRSAEAPGSPGLPVAADLDRLVGIFERVARSLETAHAAGILHRDLKPGNVSITADDHPVLLDFGLAGGPDADFATLTATGDVFGTPAYMAPERIVPDGGVEGPSADVYALGVSLYECLTLERPFRGATLAGLVQAIRSGEHLPPGRLNPAVPRDLDVIVETALECRRERRYASAAAFAEDLRRLRSNEPVSARPAPPWLRLRRWSERNPVLATALVGLFLVISTALGVTGWLLDDSEKARAELKEALDDATLGRRARQAQQAESLVRRGFQLGFGADPRKAPDLFDEALALDPTNADALAGRFLVEMPDGGAALDVIRLAPPELADDPDVAWMRGIALRVVGREEESAAVLAAAGPSTTDLRAFLEGHHAVHNFQPPVSHEVAARALSHFRQAVMRAPRPRFHHYHSWMMAANRMADVPAMEAAERAMLHHWPESPATWEAIAQFFLPFDKKKGVAALERILEFGPSPVAHMGLGYWHQGEGRLEDAVRSFRRAIEIDPTYPAAHWMLAGGLAAAGRHREAVEAHLDGILHMPGHAASLFAAQLLDSLARCDDPVSVESAIERVAEIRPGFLPALKSALSGHLSGDALKAAGRALPVTPRRQN